MRTALLTLALAACTSGPASVDSDGETERDSADSDAGTEAPASRCVEAAHRLACAHHTLVLDPTGTEDREVHWQVPAGEPPPAGWPVALFFQPSLLSAEQIFGADTDAAFGLWHQVATARALLDAGWAVIAPETHNDGATWWDTNIPPWATAWESSPDHQLMLAIFGAVDAGDLGDLDAGRMVALGMSSGGYMASRVAVAYPGRFERIAVHSASYAWCGGAACVVPELSSSHPPTLFLHGQLDTVVPITTMLAYRDALHAAGVDHEQVVDPTAGHTWLPEAPDAIATWLVR